ncbi:MAG: response regulator transcription factor [Deltaproteobacteria bacterium]
MKAGYKIRILVVDDHAIIRDGLRELLNDQIDMEVVGYAREGHEALEKARTLHPDVMLIDIAMPGMNGLAVTSLIKETAPATRIIIFTMHKKEAYVQQAIQAGALGYVLKTSPSEEIFVAVRTVFGGRQFLSPDVKDDLVDRYLNQQSVKPKKIGYDSLSEREKRVFLLMVEGKSTKEMAEILCLSPKTVEKYRSSVIRKLNIHSLVDMTKYALRIGIIDTDLFE